MDKMRQWSILTAVGVVAVLAAGWFLLVSPQKSHASDLRNQAAAQQSANATLRSQVNQLEQQKKGLPAQQRLLDQIATKIPANPELPTLIRELSSAANGAGVDLVSLAPAPPALVSAPAAATPAATTPAGTTPAAPASGAPAPATLHSAPAAASPLAQIPIIVTVNGSYYNVTSFFHAVEQLHRAMLVTQFSLAPATKSGSGPSTGKATAPDALTGTLNAVVFESPASVAAPAPTTLTPSTGAAAAPAQ